MVQAGRAVASPSKFVTNVPRVGFVSLGCPKALVDSELILTQLRSDGYEIAPNYRDSDLVVVNTCGFIDDAVRESLDAIGEALAENGRVIVTGCLGAKTAEDGANWVSQVHPKVLAVTGPHATEAVISQIHRHLPQPETNRPIQKRASTPRPTDQTLIEFDPGVKLTPPHYAYLKISEGCNHRCTFCIIPSMRGDLVSRPITEVVREAEALFKRGVRELLVISQDTSAYGVDLKYRTEFLNGRPARTRFADLAEALGRVASDYGGWVRFHYVYPYPHVDEVVGIMADSRYSNALVPYLDVPFQHAHPDVLRRMKRPANGERNLERIQAWRALLPNLTVRSTFIAGFPGETESEFQALLDFLSAAELDRVGCFAYSPVEGATANALPGAVPTQLREERRDRLMAHQADISSQRLARRVGSQERVLIDELVWLVGDDDPEDAPGEPTAIARSTADAPEIDGVVRVALHPDQMRELRVGQFINVTILAADEHDLEGRLT